MESKSGFFVGPFAFASTVLGFCLYSYQVRRALAATIRIPLAKKIPTIKFFGKHPTFDDQYRGDNLMDPPKQLEDAYDWLRDESRKNPDVIGHLKLENKYCKEGMAHLTGLQKTLYDEMLSHLKETDEDVPHQDGPFLYYSRTVKGMSYKIHCRKAISSSTDEIIILDENILAKDKEYTDISSIDPSPSHNLLAYSIDHSGYETYDLKIKNISTGQDLPDTIKDISGDIVWGADDSALFYLTMDDEHRPYKLWLHVLGTEQSDDICVHTEEDGMFWMGVGKSCSDSFIFYGAESTETSENYVIDIRGLQGGDAHKNAISNAKCIRKRIFGIRYEPEHQGDYFYIITNENNSKNNKLTRVLTSTILEDENTSNGRIDLQLEDVRPYDSNVQIDDIICFSKFIAIFGRSDGIPKIWILHSNSSKDSTVEDNSSEWKEIQFSESDYSVWAEANCVYESNILRIGYSSFITPKQILDYNMLTYNSNILKEQEIPNYNRKEYICTRIFANSRDSKKIPLSVVHHKSIQIDENNLQSGGITTCPTLLSGYGSYGACIDPSFDFKRLSLLDRGVVCIIAHIRGGGELGRSWYEDEGKYLTKMNTFNDFIDCAKYLIESKITTSEQLSIVGRSAGGLLMGAVANMAPELFKAVIADVPFVDVINTMSDPTIPLTVTEWEEWGNPNQEKYFQYMKSYSPYDNIQKQSYPAMLVTAGLNDPRVAYWEPAKWVAKLREMKTDSNPLFFKTDMSTGHFSASDRYKYIKETAFEFSFLLDQIKAKSLLKIDKVYAAVRSPIIQLVVALGAILF
eukprot:gene8346-17194_t